MKDRVINRYIGTYVLVAVIAVTLVVTPFNSIDPVNLPKLSLLVAVVFVALGLVLSKRGLISDKGLRTPLLLIMAFILQLILVLVVDNREMASKFYGTASRNTGFIAYLCLSFLLIASMTSASYLLLKRYVWALVVVGTILAIYGIAQSQGHDFYAYDNAFGANVFGSFGNPNFQSAFMGIVGAAAFTLAVFGSLRIHFRVLLVTLVILAVYNISLSSLQGYFNLVAGFAAATVVYFFQKRRPILAWGTLGVLSIGISSLLLGILDKGPLAQAIYKSSLQARGFYWRGAIDMMIQNPFFGVGMDGFGDWYRRSRPIEYLDKKFNTVSDTAHNIPLDIGSSGGFPLLFFYLLIVALALNSVYKVVARKTEFDPYFTSIFAAWIAYQAQSLISINQLGLGVWGWSLTGLLLGYEITTRESTSLSNQRIIAKSKEINEKLSAIALVVTFITSGIGLAISLPPYLAANKFYKALQSGDANIIQSAAYLQPYDRNRFLYVASILSQNKLEPQAIIVLREASKIYPDSFEIWSQWATIGSAAPADIAYAKNEMKRLDPLNPNIK